MTLTTRSADHQLKELIAQELEWAPDVNADRVGVSINRGAVTLSGQVETYPEKHTAVRAALRVRGVTAVADEIEVRNDWAPREDADLAREAAQVLESTVYSPSDSVTAVVHDRVITLSGQVGWRYQADALGRALSALPGVHGVIDSITVTPRITISASEARTQIAAALRRNALIDADGIDVDVTDDTITLTGTVSSWAEHRQATHTAWAVPGVAHVHNNLRVNS